jgi:hypothetical protein
LLPSISSLPLVKRLEHCLCDINDKGPQFQGLFDKLIQLNSQSINSPSSSQRLLKTSLDIVQIAYVADRLINTVGSEFPDPSPSRLHIGLSLNNNLSWKVIVPLQFLLKGWGDANQGHQGYIHSITHNVARNETFEQLYERQMKDQDSYYYVGITGRNWLQRLSEHVGEIHRGSRRSFHRAWRESLGMKNVQIVSSLMAINMTYDEAMNWEEAKVDQIASDQYGLNMIPGGFKGLKYLHKLRITNKGKVSLRERELAIEEYIRRNPRKGIPNPFIRALWENDDFYLKVIAARPKNLTPSQVYRIRELHADGWSPEEITEEVAALNVGQVKRVISGKAYSRIK